MFGLLATETFSIFALFPTLIKTNANRDRKLDCNNTTKTASATYDRSLSEISNECVGFDMTRGELVLFENENIFVGTVFKLAVQLYILQGAKVNI